MRFQFETENVLFSIFIAMLLAITVVMGVITLREKPHPRDKTIVVLIPATTDNVDKQARLSLEYAKLHPEIKIEPIAFPWRNIWQKLEFMIVANIPPDVSGLEQPFLPRFIHMGAIEPLDEWIRNDPDFDPEAFFPECMSESNWDGIQYGIPEGFSTVCIWYNKTLFDEAGVEYPHRDWTKDDLLAAARKLTKDVDGDGVPDQYGFFTNNNHWNRYPCWIWMDGGEFMSEDNRTSTFDDPTVIAGIEWLARLSLQERVMPSMMFLGNISANNLFLSGRLAMTTETRYFLPQFFMEKNLDKVQTFDWDVAELPRGLAGRATTFVNGSNVIPSTVPDDRKRMAWEYLKFLSSVEGQRIIADLDTAVPARMDVAWEMVASRGKPPLNDRAFIDSLPYARYLYWPFPADPQFTEARSNLYSVWTGLVDAAPICQKAARDITAAIDEHYRLNPDDKLPVKTRWVPFAQRDDASLVPAAPASAAQARDDGPAGGTPQ